MDGCRHLWQIAPPDGPTSEGVCQQCGAMRTFHNAAPMTSMAEWSYESDPQERAARRVGLPAIEWLLLEAAGRESWEWNKR